MAASSKGDLPKKWNNHNTPLRIDATTVPHFEPPSPTYSTPPTPSDSEVSLDEDDLMELELQRVKELFLNHQYKACAARCAELLPTKSGEAAHKAFLHFYTAISYEEIARSQHHQSPHVLGNIDLAAQHYNAASQALPAPIIPERKPRPTLFQPEQRRVTMIDFATNLRDDMSVYDVSRESSTSSSSRNSVNSSVYSEESASTAPSTAPSSGLPVSPIDTKRAESVADDWFSEEPDSPVSKPSPLRISKVPSLDSGLRPSHTRSISIHSLSEQVLAPKSPAKRSPDTSWLSLESDSEDEEEVQEMKEEVKNILKLLCAPRDLRQKNIQPSDRQAVQRFNKHLTSFYEMLENHAEAVYRLRQKTVKLQSQERGRPPTKKERIARGRETGWKRPRFDAERYQALCDEVLADL